MSFDPLSAALDLGKIAIDRFFPDPIEKAKELRKLEELHQQGDLAELNSHVQLMVGQLKVNVVEAAHKSIFVAGWRPFIGWVGGSALAYKFLIYPLIGWGWTIAQVYEKIPEGVVMPPAIDAAALYPIILGMLGIGAQRSYDKSKGTHTNSIRGR